jgi:hypothetical protein
MLSLIFSLLSSLLFSQLLTSPRLLLPVPPNSTSQTHLSPRSLLFLNLIRRPQKGKRVRLLFQPAEEGPGGALPMMQAGCLESVEEVYGMV